MFPLVDKDRNGFISFREFVDMLIIFAKGKSSIFNVNATIYTLLQQFVCTALYSGPRITISIHENVTNRGHSVNFGYWLIINISQ
jgi:hypothetical protein